MLSNIYTKTLTALQKIPKDAAYRRNTEQIVQQRLQIVQAVSKRTIRVIILYYYFLYQETSVPVIEELIGCGQVEELVDQAKRELSLVGNMEEWRSWEPVIGEPPPGQWEWP